MVEAFKTQVKTLFGSSKSNPTVSVSVDFPKEKEVVNQGHYAIRISGDVSGRAEVQINGGEWKVCRIADGYHWFDWYPQKAGPSKISARIRQGASAWVTSSERTCTVTTSRGK
jgi:hypothetical protein